MSTMYLFRGVFNNFGRCPYCMRKSLELAAGSLVALLATVVLFDNNVLLVLAVGAVAVALTFIYALHFGSHAARLFLGLKSRVLQTRRSTEVVSRLLVKAIAITWNTAFSGVRPVMASSSASEGGVKPSSTPPKGNDSTIEGISNCGGNNNTGYCPDLCYRVMPDNLCWRCHSCTTGQYNCYDSYPGGC